MKKEAMVVMASCQQTGKKFGIRAERVEDGILMNWAFAVKEERAKREGFENNCIRGSVMMSEEYPGCPHCGAPMWFQCGKCQRLVCMQGEEKTVKCPECGCKSKLTAAEEFNLSGGGM